MVVHETLTTFCASTGRGEKRDLYEGGSRIPMIARAQNPVPARSDCRVPWAQWDVLPTLAELAGRARRSVVPPQAHSVA